MRPALATLACGALVAGAAAERAAAQLSPATLRTTLPLVVIDSSRPIADGPKTPARMRVIHRGGGRVNTVRGRANVYAGEIGIEPRGHSSSRFPKRSFTVETRKPDGSARNVPLLGMPKENDWVLYASYNDKTLLRNVLAHRTARRLGHYSSRTRFVELVLNGRYEGVYVLMEKVKVDRNRVRLDARNVTGGYLLESSALHQLGNKGHFRTPLKGKPLRFYDPERKALTKARVEWITRHVSDFELDLYGRSFRDPQTGYRRSLDVPAAVDYVLLNELFKNQDAFQTSTFLSKSAGGKIRLGPIWDFDVSMGNSNFGPSSVVAGWMLDRRWWADRLYQDPDFTAALARRWRGLRAGGLVEELKRTVDREARAIAAARVRNFQRWRVLGRYVWPNPLDPATGRVRRTYAAELAYLKAWLDRRAAWLDANVDSM